MDRAGNFDSRPAFASDVFFVSVFCRAALGLVFWFFFGLFVCLFVWARGPSCARGSGRARCVRGAYNLCFIALAPARVLDSYRLILDRWRYLASLTRALKIDADDAGEKKHITTRVLAGGVAVNLQICVLVFEVHKLIKPLGADVHFVSHHRKFNSATNTKT